MDRPILGSGESDRLASGELQKEANRGTHLLQMLDQVGNFVRTFRTKLRFGELSRAPLHLLRFQLQGEMAECDWLARRPDDWDESLPLTKRQITATQQALEDSLAVRTWLFRTLPGIKSATVRVFRETGDPERQQDPHQPHTFASDRRSSNHALRLVQGRCAVKERTSSPPIRGVLSRPPFRYRD